MFNQFYQNRSRKIIQFILNTFSHKYFMSKNVVDLGAGHGDISAGLFRLGASVTAVDAREDHLKAIARKYPNITTSKIDLDNNFILNTNYNVCLFIGTLCHIKNYEKALRHACHISQDLILETAVLDSDHVDASLEIKEHKGVFDASFSGFGSRVSAERIEKILSECGMNYTRVDSQNLNHDNFVYDWKVTNSGKSDLSLRRLWVCSKNAHVVPQIKNKIDSDVKYGEPANKIPVESNVRLQKPLMARNQPQVNTSYNQREVNFNIIPPTFSSENNKPFVIVIPSYKNEAWAEKNILSALNQNYDNFRILFTDDCSPDNTFDIVKRTIDNHKNADKCVAIKNQVRKGALENLYNMIYSCSDEEIILTLDGDDWFPNGEVLNKLNAVYQNNNVWMTYGQYQNYPDGGIGVAKQIPQHVINSNGYRQYHWCSTHLRTFYTWLFKNIKKEDLMYEGKFMSMTWDMAMMFPMLEMAKEKSRFISDILYIYNLNNPINDHKVNQKLQQNLDRLVRTKAKYLTINKPPIIVNKNKKKIGLLLIATGKYDRFVQLLIESADKYFFNDPNYEVTYHIFTDKQLEPQTNKKYKIIPIEHRGFPYASMDRFKHFTNNFEDLAKMDYLYYVDVDCKFVGDVSSEVLGSLTGVRHCGYYNGGGTFEDNKNSVFYVNPNSYKYYYGGGFSGGKSDEYLKLSSWCYDMIEKDLANGIIPRFHDETAINRYFLDNAPQVILSPSYHYPQSGIEHYKLKWQGNNFQPKILLLDKNHKEIRA
jgi:glycosyltransferase involved in cell wall biosynthesis